MTGAGCDRSCRVPSGSHRCHRRRREPLGERGLEIETRAAVSASALLRSLQEPQTTASMPDTTWPITGTRQAHPGDSVLALT